MLASQYRIERTEFVTMPYSLYGKRGAVYDLWIPMGDDGLIYDSDQLIAIAASGRTFRLGFIYGFTHSLPAVSSRQA